MISTLSGTVQDVQLDGCVLEIAGVGFQVALSPRHAITLSVGSEASIFTRLVVREDDLSLFGFASSQDRQLFDLLCSVSGIGPKLAMTVLSGMDAQAIAHAVNTQNESAFRSISGVGPKTAKLIIISLAGKVGATLTSANQTVLSALTQLGTPENEARAVLEKLPKDLSDSDLLKAALSELGKKRLV